MDFFNDESSNLSLAELMASDKKTTADWQKHQHIRCISSAIRHFCFHYIVLTPVLAVVSVKTAAFLTCLFRASHASHAATLVRTRKHAVFVPLFRGRIPVHCRILLLWGGLCLQCVY